LIISFIDAKTTIKNAFDKPSISLRQAFDKLRLTAYISGLSALCLLWPCCVPTA